MFCDWLCYSAYDLFCIGSCRCGCFGGLVSLMDVGFVCYLVYLFVYLRLDCCLLVILLVFVWIWIVWTWLCNSVVGILLRLFSCNVDLFDVYYLSCDSTRVCCLLICCDLVFGLEWFTCFLCLVDVLIACWAFWWCLSMCVCDCCFRFCFLVVVCLCDLLFVWLFIRLLYLLTLGLGVLILIWFGLFEFGLWCLLTCLICGFVMVWFWVVLVNSGFCLGL